MLCRDVNHIRSLGPHTRVATNSFGSIDKSVIAANLGFHRFWSVEDPVLHRLELSLFFKNLAIAGGLLMLLPRKTMVASPV